MRYSERLGMPAADVAWMAVTALLAGVLVVTLAGCTGARADDGGRVTAERVGEIPSALGGFPVYEVIDHETGRSYLAARDFVLVETSRPTDGPVVYDKPATGEAADE